MSQDRFVVDGSVALALAAEPRELRAGLELYSSTYLRSETLSALHEAAHRGELDPATSRRLVATHEPWTASASGDPCGRPPVASGRERRRVGRDYFR